MLLNITFRELRRQQLAASVCILYPQVLFRFSCSDTFCASYLQRSPIQPFFFISIEFHTGKKVTNCRKAKVLKEKSP